MAESSSGWCGRCKTKHTRDTVHHRHHRRQDLRLMARAERGWGARESGSTRPPPMSNLPPSSSSQAHPIAPSHPLADMPHEPASDRCCLEYSVSHLVSAHCSLSQSLTLKINLLRFLACLQTSPLPGVQTGFVWLQYCATPIQISPCATTDTFSVHSATSSCFTLLTWPLTASTV